MNILVNSETGRLRRVLMKQPSPSLDRVTPGGAKGKLLNGIVSHRHATMEHNNLVRILTILGVEVVCLMDLLETVMSDNDILGSLLTALFVDEEVVKKASRLTRLELKRLLCLGTQGDPSLEGDFGIIETGENDMFTRDPGATIGRTFLYGSASKPARSFEFRLQQELVKLSFPGIVSTAETDRTLEGGDVLVINQNVVCVGISERTSWKALEAVVPLIPFEHVIAVQLPETRASIHLDTIFTMTKRDQALAYFPRILGNNENDPCPAYCFSGKDRVREDYDNLPQALAAVGNPVDLIRCGGIDPVNQEREQWTSGANCLAVAPGLIITYARNEYTVKEFEKAGYQHFCAEDLLGRLRGRIPTENSIITFDGADLANCHGGPHCLTFPLERDPV